jgi:hypothetical protein
MAVVIGSFVIMGLYSLYSISMRAYRLQDQTMEAWGHLRTGATQLKADLRSAAFNAPAQSDKEDWVFVLGASPIYAVAIDVDPDVPVASPAQNENVFPQRITLTGDFESHQTFTTSMVQGQDLVLQWGPTNGDETEFNRIFSPTNLVRIELYGVARQEQIIPIDSASYNGGNNPTVSLTASVQNIQGFGSGHEVTVLSRVRYRLQRDTKRDKESVKYDLIREKLDRSGLPVMGSWLVVAEYIVDLQVLDLCFNTTTPIPGSMQQLPVLITCYPTLSDLADSPHKLTVSGNNDSHLLRSLTFKLSARASYEDPIVMFSPRTSEVAPLRAFDIDPTMKGAARVVETASTTFFTSIQARRQ